MSKEDLYKRIDAAAEAADDMHGTIPWTDLVVEATLAEVREAVVGIDAKVHDDDYTPYLEIDALRDILALFEPGGRFAEREKREGK